MQATVEKTLVFKFVFIVRLDLVTSINVQKTTWTSWVKALS